MNLCHCPHSETPDVCYKLCIQQQSRIFISDALNHRSIFHQMDRKSLIIYEFSQTKYFRHIVVGANVLLFLLPFVEWPSSLTLNSDLRHSFYRPDAPCGVTEAIELICVGVILADSLCLSYAFKTTWTKSNPWLFGRFILITVYYIDLVVSLSMKCTEFYRIRRFFRPYFLISGSQLMKKLLKCIRRTLDKLLSTLFLLFFWLLSASFVAISVFSKSSQSGPEKNETITSSFPDLYTSMFNILVLTTTANHPDVLVNFYNANRATALFSVGYLSVGLYVFMNILTATVYSQFRGYLLDSVQARLTRRRVATRAAFEVLRLANGGLDVVTSDDIIQLLEGARIRAWQKELLRETYISTFADSDLNASQFMQLFRILDLSAPPGEELGLRYLPPGPARTFQTFVTSSYFAKLSIGVAILNFVSLTVELSGGSKTMLHLGVQMQTVRWCFVIFYLFEEFATMWAKGPKVFFSRWANLFTLGTALALFISESAEAGFLLAERSGVSLPPWYNTMWKGVRFSNVLLVMRAARVVCLFTWTQLVAGVLADLPTNLAPVLGIFASIYYVYALLGLNLFHGAITYDRNSSQKFECGTYQQLGYWAVNFDDFAASIVVLWDLMVVNNWHVIVAAYEKALNKWVHVYMISWWLIAVVGMLSLVTAFVFETFVHRRDLYYKAVAQMSKPMEVILLSGHSTSTSRAQNGLNSHSHTSEHCVTNSSQPGPSTPSGQVVKTVGFLEVDPHSGLTQRSSLALNISSLDELFKSVLREPTEEEMMVQINQHTHIKQMREHAAFRRTVGVDPPAN